MGSVVHREIKPPLTSPTSIVALVMLFVVVGVLYRRFALNLRGFDQLPRMPNIFASCGAGIARLRDMLEDAFSRRSDPYDRYGSAWSGWGRGGRVGFDRVPASFEEAESILGPDGDETPRQSLEDGHGASNPWSGHNGQARPAGMDNEGVIRL
jgi:cation-dependent mannose-6-phosphate receptor